MMDIKPFLHEHHLLFDNYEKQEACCDQCNQQIDGSAFNCEICKFWLHKSCAVQQLPHRISHPLHSQHFLTLISNEYHDSKYFVCNGCSGLTRNCLYQCAHCDFSLDLICASSIPTNTSHRYKKIFHFCHIDYLIQFRYRKVGKKEYCCFWCEKLLSGISYGCFYCQLYIHETCLIDMPTRISNHPFHPSHPLHLACSSFWDKCYVCTISNFCGRLYSCKKCKFWLHPHCANVKPSLKHKLHEHHLTLFQNRNLFSHYGGCMKCKKMGYCCRNSLDNVFKDHYYLCTECGFKFHFRCLVPSSSVKHEYHRHELILIDFFVEDDSNQHYCDICEQERLPQHPVYYCKKCTFTAHIGCTLDKITDDVKFDWGSTSSLVGAKASIEKVMEEDERNADSSPNSKKIEYFDHIHPLKSYNEFIAQNKRDYLCKACWVENSDEAYGCESCKYYIHKKCTKLPFEMLHPLHPQHSLKLMYSDAKSDNLFTCEECRDVTDGYSYECIACDFKLDVKCALLWVPKGETQRLKEMERPSKLCLFNQHHNLNFTDAKVIPTKDFAPYNYICGFCNQYLMGPNYRCFDCNYALHESCLGLTREMQLQFHPQHPFHPLRRSRKDCCVCNRRFSYGIEYGCVQCDLHLHPQCAKSLKLVLKSKSHVHDLYYFVGINTAINIIEYGEHICGECRRRFFRSPFCFCMECDIELHLECAVPSSLKSKYHIHPLTLENGFMEDDSVEYYCDICEKERDPKDHVYNCKECQGYYFVAHLSCALNSEEKTAAAEEASSSLKRLT